MRTFSVKRQIARRNAVDQVLTWYVFALVLVNQERRLSVFFSGFFNVTPFILLEISLNTKSKSVVETLKYNYRTRAIITRELYTFYPLFEVHLCTVTFGLMYG